MAYLARIEPQDSQPVAFPALVRAGCVQNPISRRSNGRSSAWRGSTVCGRSARPAGCAASWNWLLARGNPSLANEKLEALRRMAVLTWHYGFTVPGEDVRRLPLRRLLAGPI